MEFVHTPSLVSPNYLQQIFADITTQNEVIVVTSSLPGLGKSEAIQRIAFQKRLLYVNIHVLCGINEYTDQLHFRLVDLLLGRSLYNDLVL